MVTILHLFLYKKNIEIWGAGSSYSLTMQTMPLFFSTVQGGGIQSKTYLISSSSLNKSLHQTSLFLNERFTINIKIYPFTASQQHDLVVVAMCFFKFIKLHYTF